MRYTVVWLPTAQTKLATIWMQATDRHAVSQASTTIDDYLKYAPLSVGQAFGRYRRLTVFPLQVVYRVSTPDCLVEVIQVAYLH